MAMRMDPPEPPGLPVTPTWWRRQSGNHEGRLLYAKIVDRRAGLVLVQYYADPAEPARWEQRYISRAVAERVLERQRWERWIDGP